MKFVRWVTFVAICVCAPSLSAKTVKKEVVEETEKRETRRFCSKKSADEARKECERWMSHQSKSLGDRLLTSYCDQGELNTDVQGSCMYRVIGEVKYVLKTFRTEEVSTD